MTSSQKVFLVIGLATILGVAIIESGCTTQQVQQAQIYQNKIAGACAVAMTLVSVAGAVAPWIIGGCSTEAAIAKLALDPNSLAWIQNLVAKAKGAA